MPHTDAIVVMTTLASADEAVKLVRALLVESSGKIVIVGDFTMVNGTPASRVARLTSTGAVDPTFNSGGAGANALVRAPSCAAF